MRWVSRRSRFATSLGVVTLIGFAWRVVYVLAFRRDLLPLEGDSFYYHQGANLLADGFGFIDPLHLTTFVEWPSASHPPLYEVWLAIPSWLLGTQSPTGHMLWSCVLGAITIVLAGLAGREIGGPRVGLIAAMLAAVYPNIWVHDGAALSETMAICTTVLVIWLAYRCIRLPTSRSYLALGVACGLAALSRSELLLLVPFVIGPVALTARSHTARQRVARMVIAAIAATFVVLPWVGYNLSRFEEPVLFSSNFGGTLAAANCDATYYGRDLGFKNYECAQTIDDRVYDPTYDESQLDKAVRREATQYIKDHKSRVPIVILARWGRALGVFHPTNDVAADMLFAERERWVAEAARWTWYLVFGLGVVGGLVLRRSRRTMFPLVVVIAVTFIAIGATFAQTRYRAPAEIALVLLAAVAIDRGLGWRQTRTSARDTPTRELSPNSPHSAVATRQILLAKGSKCYQRAMLRPRILGSCAVAIALTVGAVVPAADGATLLSHDWSSAGRNGSRTSYNPTSGVSNTTLPTYQRLWSASGGKFSAPILTQGTIVVADNGVNGRSRLESYNATTGARRWTVDFGASSGATVGPPATDGARAFVMIERPSGLLWRYDIGAYDLATGAKVWSAGLGITPSRLGTRPVLTANGAVFVLTTRQNSFSVIKKFTGGGVWQWDLDEGTKINSLAVSAGVVFVASDDLVNTYDADTSDYVGRRYGGALSIAVSGNALYYATATTVGAADRNYFAPLWSRPTAGCAGFVRVVTSSLALMSQCRTAPPIVSLALTGAQWNLQALAAGDTPIAASKTVIIAVTATGGLKAWNPATGFSVAIPQPSAPARLSGQSGPILASNLLVVPEDGRLEVFGP